MSDRPLTVAWFSFFPVEWLADIPDELRRLPRVHPATWQQVLLAEFEGRRDLRLHIVVLRKQFERNLTFERKGVSFHLIKTPAGLRAPTFFWLDTWLIKRALADIRPDAVHAWGTEQGAALAASRMKYPYVVTMQGLLSWYEELVPLNRYQRFAAFLERRSLARTPLATTESAFAVQYLRRKFPKLDVRQVEHAPGWAFHQLERRPQTRPVRFIYIGTLTHIKGVDLLLRALDQLKNELVFEMLMIGKPVDLFLEKCKVSVSPELWRRMEFKADLSSHQVAQELATATMMIFPTRADTSPNSVKEAVVAGVPVVASAIGGIVDYVFPGENGFLFPSENLDALVSAIKEACQHPLFRQGQVEPSALNRVRAYLSPKRMSEEFFGIYGDLVSEKDEKFNRQH